MIEEFKGVNLIDFIDRFSNDEKCKEYLAKIKWATGFRCSKCCNDKHWGSKKDLFVKVCTNCRHIQSVTANTLFHKVKFGLRKAFLIIFEMSTTTKSCSALVMAKKYGVNQKTSWLFMHKVRKAMASSTQHPLKGCCEVDEALLGGKVSGKRGRGALKKKKVSIAIEKTQTGGIGRAYAMSIADFSATELRKIFNAHIEKSQKLLIQISGKGTLLLSRNGI